MKYDKIIKWVLLALFVVGVVFSFYGFAVGFESNGNAPVDNILYCAYGFAALTIAAVFFGVVVIGGLNNPKSLLKLLLGIVVIAAVVAGGMKVALITTVGGLIVAVILQIFYNYKIGRAHV